MRGLRSKSRSRGGLRCRLHCRLDLGSWSRLGVCLVFFRCWCHWRCCGRRGGLRDSSILNFGRRRNSFSLDLWLLHRCGCGYDDLGLWLVGFNAHRCLDRRRSSRF